MKVLKTILSIVGLLLIGFAGGFYAHRMVTMQKLEEIRELGRAPNFERHFFESINATPEQREQLDPIIAKHSTQMAAFLQESREKRRALMQELHHAVKPHLTAEQVEKMKKFSRRFARENKMKKNRATRKKQEE